MKQIKAIADIIQGRSVHWTMHATSEARHVLKENLGQVMEKIRFYAVRMSTDSFDHRTGCDAIARISRQLLKGLEYGVDGNGHARRSSGRSVPVSPRPRVPASASSTASRSHGKRSA